MSLALNRNSKIGGIAQTAFRKIGGFTKCCKFDGVNDIAKIDSLTKANILSIFDTTLPFTVYSKFRLNADSGDAVQFFLSVSRPATVDNYRFGAGLVRVDATNFQLYFASVDGTGAAVVRVSANLAWATYIGTVMTIAYKIDSTTNALTYYLNGSPISTSAPAGTLMAPSGLAAVNDYIVSIGGRYIDSAAVFNLNATMINIATFGEAYTQAECETNMANALFRLKFNDAVGTTLTNSGSTAGSFNPTCSGITESAFHTLVKEA